MFGRFGKVLLKKTFTKAELAKEIDHLLVNPPSTPELREMAQSWRSKNGRGLLDHWREVVILRELDEIANQPTWATQRRKLLELVMEAAVIRALDTAVRSTKSVWARSILLEDTFDVQAADEMEATDKKEFLLAQQYVLSLTSFATLLELGTKVYGLDDVAHAQIDLFDGLTRRHQQLRALAADFVFSYENDEDAREAAQYKADALDPVIEGYRRLVIQTQDRIAAGTLDVQAFQKTFGELEAQIDALVAFGQWAGQQSRD